jgi:hypothetical protein
VLRVPSGWVSDGTALAYIERLLEGEDHGTP